MCPRGVKLGVASSDYQPQETNERQLRDDVIDSLISPPEGIPGLPENQIWSSILQDNQQDAGCETLFFSRSLFLLVSMGTERHVKHQKRVGTLNVQADTEQNYGLFFCTCF